MKKLIFFIAAMALGYSAFANSVSAKKAKQNIVKVEISEDGFIPAKINVQKGEDLVLLITRKTNNTCVKELKTANQANEVPLPLNKEVEFKVGKLDKTGDVKLLCGMNMTAGVITVM
jgi:plastocyanin domain-containing protein